MRPTGKARDPTEDRMFHAKMNEEEDDELPAFDDEAEGEEQPQEIVEEVE